MNAKKRFSQKQWDTLTLRKAKATLALRKAREAVRQYEKTHTSGIAHERRHKSR
jgi:hypothetical protein